MLNNYQEIRAATAAARGCDAAWRGEGNVIQASTGFTVPIPDSMAFTLCFRCIDSISFDNHI